MLNLVAGFQLPSRGRISLDGSPITGASADRGVVFQGDDALFPWLNGKDNVAFGLKMRGVQAPRRETIVDHYLNLVHLSAHADKYPGEMSGGMKQRIQIARVLANEPKVLLMDEPFGALDAQTRSKLQDDLVEIWMKTRKTIIFITHDIAEAIMLSDRIVLLSKGPGSRVSHVVDVDLERPRRRGDPRFGQIWETISELIEGEEVRA
ncbi:MAG: ABC transporter ATP-binding protein [Burkholderiaceae bacterium]|nr:ABC transporter ATP-binding protein [Burkholderiaceae bacterium]